MLTAHTDPDDMESVALLDRTWANNKQQHHQSKRDKRKFDKIINKKDNELREIAEKVQKQSQALDEVTAVLRTPPSLLGPQPPRRKCISMTPSSLGVVLVALALLFGLPLLLYIGNSKFRYFNQ